MYYIDALTPLTRLLRAMYIIYTCGGHYDGPLKSAGINDHRYNM